MMDLTERLMAHLTYKIAEHRAAAADHNKRADALDDYRRYFERQVDDETARLRKLAEAEEAKIEAACIAEIN